MPASGHDYAAQLALLGDDLERLERRLRGLSVSAWRTRAAVIRSLLVDLSVVEAGLRGAPPSELPEIAEYALADALAVISGDLVDALVEHEAGETLAGALSAVRSAIASTR